MKTFTSIISIIVPVIALAIGCLGFTGCERNPLADERSAWQGLRESLLPAAGDWLAQATAASDQERTAIHTFPTLRLVRVERCRFSYRLAGVEDIHRASDGSLRRPLQGTVLVVVTTTRRTAELTVGPDLTLVSLVPAQPSSNGLPLPPAMDTKTAIAALPPSIRNAVGVALERTTEAAAETINQQVAVPFRFDAEVGRWLPVGP